MMVCQGFCAVNAKSVTMQGPILGLDLSGAMRGSAAKPSGDVGESTTPHHFQKTTHKSQSGWIQSYCGYSSSSNAIGCFAEVGPPDMRPSVENNYLGFDLIIPDALRAAQFIRGLKQHLLGGRKPNSRMVWLPDDHTGRRRFGSPTPEAWVAEMIFRLEKLLQSKFAVCSDNLVCFNTRHESPHQRLRRELATSRRISGSGR
jgi:hypothetical protein